MIKILNKLENLEPYSKFYSCYENAHASNQKSIEAINICSYSNELNEVSSRFVNLKYIIKNEWIFFSNYKSSKANDFFSHPQISAVFFWDSINTQIRIKGKIKKTDKIFSDNHFSLRSREKNILAIIFKIVYLSKV